MEERIPKGYQPQPALVGDLDAALRALAENQREVSILAPAVHDYDVLGPEPQAIRNCLLALTVEISELAQACQIKSWRADHLGPAAMSTTEQRRIIEEFADILAFMGLLIHYLQASGIPCIDLAREYETKSIENVRRFTSRDTYESRITPKD